MFFRNGVFCFILVWSPVPFLESHTDANYIFKHECAPIHFFKDALKMSTWHSLTHAQLHAGDYGACELYSINPFVSGWCSTPPDLALTWTSEESPGPPPSRAEALRFSSWRGERARERKRESEREALLDWIGLHIKSVPEEWDFGYHIALEGLLKRGLLYSISYKCFLPAHFMQLMLQNQKYFIDPKEGIGSLYTSILEYKYIRACRLGGIKSKIKSTPLHCCPDWNRFAGQRVVAGPGRPGSPAFDKFWYFYTRGKLRKYPALNNSLTKTPLTRICLT